ncbi:ABC transporter transmembrane domain-containing protein [Sphaerotilus uruguayifluvii]|uniref:Subfamily B ATP-binding cassette protein MsbA n=1 Tax=Sphaerotilus uruguayifluvii TaxID=2735897 RepID=A0ABX2G4I2_9BURK|nr:ABC transporter transmembrane domain-containing protein [Leptothrix sp. C29]NRT56285.1 subfamily B ATP-binding cassette protein MsbA [Leptothrix sp. C29]
MTTETPEINHRATLRRLLTYVARHRVRFIASIVALLMTSAIEPAIPALFKKLLDSGFQAADSFPIWMVPAVVILLFAVRGLTTFSGTYLMTDASSRVIYDVRQDLMRSLLKVDAKVFGWLTPGLAVNKIISDPQGSITSLSANTNSLLRSASTFLFLLGYLFYLNFQLTILSMVTVPLLIVLVRRLHKRVSKVGGLEYESQQRLVNIVDDAARAWRIVRTFDAAGFEQQRFEREAWNLRRLLVKRTATSALLTPATQVVSALAVSIILSLALWQARNGQASVGDFVAFLTALLMTISPLKQLTDVSQSFVHSLIGLRGAFELIDAPEEPDPGTRELPACRGDIDVRALEVRYPDSPRAAIDGVSMAIRPGQTVAFVGASGAGKTTMVSTLLGFVQPTGGDILIDGVSIQDIRRPSLRRHFAVVSQDIVLFDGSIAANVTYAQPRDDARVEACLRAANLWSFVEQQPDGMEAAIGVNGSRLSGGQRQRLAIARALYKDSAVWIFDEATSALDAESERVVQQSIEQLSGDKTIILIAHRLSTVRRADRIFVFEDGRVVESGTHAELVLQGGRYAAMVRSQDVTIDVHP